MKNGGLLSKMRAFWAETSGLFIVSGRVSFWGTRCLSHSAAPCAIPRSSFALCSHEIRTCQWQLRGEGSFRCKRMFLAEAEERTKMKWRASLSSESVSELIFNRGRNSDCWTARCSKFQAYYLLVFTKVVVFDGCVWQNEVFLSSKAYFKLKNCAFSNSSCIFVLEI